MNETARKVWVVNDGGHDYTPADSFGEVRYLTTGRFNPLSSDRMALEIAKSIGNIVNNADDYLLLSGLPIANAIALFMWLRKFHKANVLLWNPKARVYKLNTIEDKHLDRLLDSAITGVR